MSNQPRSGQIYRHYKGKIAMVLAIAKFTPEHRSAVLYCQARSTEDDSSVYLYREADGTIVQPSIVGSPLVIYACSGEIWFRDIANFTEILGDVHDPIGGTMFNRFQLLQESKVRSLC